jgi:hypothetical protein
MIAASLAAALGLLGTMASAAMAESEEFIKAGNKVTVAHGESLVSLPGAEVECETAVGSGEVATATIMKLEVKYEKCKAFAKEFKELEAKVTPCGFEFDVEHTAALTKGCKVESTGCVVEVTPTKLEGEVEYVNLKEGAELETDVSAGIKEIEAKASGFACELAGVKSGKATATTSLTLDGMDATQQRYIIVAGASAMNEKTMVLKSLPSTIMTFTFPGGRVIECEKLASKGTTAFESRVVRFMGGFAYEGCKGNLISAGTKVALTEGGKMKTTNCIYWFGAGNTKVVTPWPGAAGNRPSTSENSCAFEATVEESGKACKIKFAKEQLKYGVWLTNEAGPPKTIKLKYSETNRAPFELAYTAENCPAVPKTSNAVVKGEAKFEIEGGTNTEVM